MWADLQEQFYKTFIDGDAYKLFLEGFKNTLIITFAATIIGILIGILVAIAKVYHAQTGKLKWLDVLCNVYLTVFRGTPVVVQLLIMYFLVLTSAHGVVVAIITFGINSGAYVSETVRAGIMAIDIGQTEAGRSLGLSSWKTMRLIILPQAIKNILPALGNEFIALLKETSVVGYVTVVDLTRAGNIIRAQTMEPFFSLIFVALVYLILVIIFTKILSRFERRLQRSDRNQRPR